MKIEVGEYIRTKQGDISKVKHVDEENIFLEDSVWSKNDLYEKTNVLYFDDEEIAKHSKSIIDLIEVGDYVNGGKVVEHAHEKGRLFVSCTYVGGIVYTTFEDYSWELKKDNEENIETIVTKEQFSNMEYRV